MGIVKKDMEKLDDERYTPFQVGVLSILDEYDYEILDLRYIEEFNQVVVTANGFVLFIQPEDITLSFEVSMTPEKVSNLSLILAETVSPKRIHITDNFIIVPDSQGANMAVFGPDAEELYKQEIAKARTTNSKYLAILMSPKVKFYNC